ncbi:MAG: 2,3-bisphosphoglycerate-independent phosphoglycerate mutase [Candidatus Spechtbacteria bacterium]|nr:2,3-bisphosphoglycerate-independent phosphoglycerate mutase [Candidatus Spechtbacteria bacterium]
MPDKKKFILAILDGWGIAPQRPGNAVFEAKTPTMDVLTRSYPYFLLQASGIGVGLPWGEEGNSEVGHLNIGAGKIVFQYLPRIIAAIRDGSFFQNPAFLKATNHVRQNNSTLHMMGLLSSGSVHSYIDHLYSLLTLAKQQEIDNVVVHVFTDGKDSPPTEGATFIRNLQERMSSEQTGAMGTIMGRNYAMDRNQRWELTRRAYNLLTKGIGNKTTDPVAYLQNSYAQGINDTDIEPAVIVPPNSPDQPPALIKDNDAIIFFNFREDSARQLTRIFVMPPAQENIEVEEGEAYQQLKNIVFVGLTNYDPLLPIDVAFMNETIAWPLGRVLSKAGYHQLHIAETEKYAHVTYFLNGQQERPFEGEERQLIPSVGTPHYDQFPEMGAPKITQYIEEHFSRFDCAIVNYANADMLGHTGNLAATIEGVRTVDTCINRLLALAQGNDAYLFITADHGNAEQMRDPRTATIRTQHTVNPVPFLVVHESLRHHGMFVGIAGQEPTGLLSDVAPTILHLINILPPPTMTGKNLLAG